MGQRPAPVLINPRKQLVPVCKLCLSHEVRCRVSRRRLGPTERLGKRSSVKCLPHVNVWHLPEAEGDAPGVFPEPPETGGCFHGITQDGNKPSHRVAAEQTAHSQSRGFITNFVPVHGVTPVQPSCARQGCKCTLHASPTPAREPGRGLDQRLHPRGREGGNKATPWAAPHCNREQPWPAGLGEAGELQLPRKGHYPTGGRQPQTSTWKVLGNLIFQERHGPHFSRTVDQCLPISFSSFLISGFKI